MKEEDIKTLPINVFIRRSDAEHGGGGGSGGSAALLDQFGVINTFCNIAK